MHRPVNARVPWADEPVEDGDRLGWGLIVAATLWLGAVILFPSAPSVAMPRKD